MILLLTEDPAKQNEGRVRINLKPNVCEYRLVWCEEVNDVEIFWQNFKLMLHPDKDNCTEKEYRDKNCLRETINIPETFKMI